MFLRATVRKKDGKKHTYYSVVENKRLADGRVVHDPIGIFSESAEKLEVRFNEEIKRNYRAEASRYYGLYAGQQSRAIMALGKFAGWRATHTCATWATEKIAEIFGVTLQSTEGFALTNTPRALGHAIRVLETTERTSIQQPKYVGHT